MKQGLVRLLYNLGKVHGVDITHDNVCSSMLSCFYSHLLSTGRPISSYCLFQKHANLLVGSAANDFVFELCQFTISSNKCVGHLRSAVRIKETQAITALFSILCKKR